MPPSDWLPQATQDGSFTFFSAEFGESFHSSLGAKSEAFEKFVQATDLREKARQPQIKLLDVCYGLGYNTAAAIATITQINAHCQIELYGLEIDPTVPLGAIAPPLLDTWPFPIQEILIALAQQHDYETPRIKAQLLIGDARQTIQTLHSRSFSADAIFFDPFSPRRCPQLWSVEFFQAIARCLSPSGKLATYSRAAATRSALLSAGFAIGSIPLPHPDPNLPHEWSQGTVAVLDRQRLVSGLASERSAYEASAVPPAVPHSLVPLSIMEQEHLKTRAAVPYRDPQLQDAIETIVQRHHQEQQQSGLESTSSWRRRWGIR